MVIPESIRTEIDRRLDLLEDEHNVRVLYACESGSRAWGFESPDSDYDVRFIYAHPSYWYLSIDIESKRDVIEVPIEDDFDLAGWDIRKALALFRKSNPPLYEWLHSPIVYRTSSPFASRLLQLTERYYNLTSARYHYLSMATSNYRSYLTRESIILKKYLYVLRPLLAVNWIEADKGIVPMEFETLVAGTVSDPSMNREIQHLLSIKRTSGEKAEGPPLPAIQQFIEAELARLSATAAKFPKPQFQAQELDTLFRETIVTPDG